MSEIINPQDFALIQAFRRDLWALPERDDTDQVAKRRLRRRHGVDPIEFFCAEPTEPKAEPKKNTPEAPPPEPAGYYETEEDTFYYSYGDVVVPGSLPDRRFWIGTALAAGTIATFLIVAPALMNIAEITPQRHDQTFSDNLEQSHTTEPQIPDQTPGPAQYWPPDPSTLHSFPTPPLTK